MYVYLRCQYGNCISRAIATNQSIGFVTPPHRAHRQIGQRVQALLQREEAIQRLQRRGIDQIAGGDLVQDVARVLG